MSSVSLLADSTTALSALSAVSRETAEYQSADDATLLALNELAARQRRLIDAQQAVIAGEIAHRSSRALGQSGMAQRAGFRSAEEFLRGTTGATGRDAATAVAVGRMLRESATEGQIDPQTGEVATPSRPWLADVAAAVRDSRLSTAAAEAIANGLGVPTDDIGAATLAAAARQLIVLAESLDPDRLFRRARQLRDELDTAGVADRERARFLARGLRHVDLPNGMGRLTWDLDPETNTQIKQILDRATSPRRGGVRFVSGENKEKAERIVADPRSTPQLASDVFLALLRAGSDADSTQLLGSGAPSVKVLITARDLGATGGGTESGEGAGADADAGDRPRPRPRYGIGFIEGQSDPVSLETVERSICCGGLIPVIFSSDGQPLDLGREQRLFTSKQKSAMAARDGGCIVDTCDRPPGGTEAHHIKFWDRDGGATDVADGVLLCPFHHKLFHNNHWEIERVGGQYFLIPPHDVDPKRTPIPTRSKSGAMRRLREEERVRDEG